MKSDLMNFLIWILLQRSSFRFFYIRFFLSISFCEGFLSTSFKARCLLTLIRSRWRTTENWSSSEFVRLDFEHFHASLLYNSLRDRTCYVVMLTRSDCCLLLLWIISWLRTCEWINKVYDNFLRSCYKDILNAKKRNMKNHFQKNLH